MKKMVVSMDVHDEISREKIIKTVATCSGITSITMDSIDAKLTVIGEFDIRMILTKLQRKWKNAKLATYGPYDPKKEAERAAAAERTRMEERERERLEAYRGNNSLYGPTLHQICVSDHDPYVCIIS